MLAGSQVGCPITIDTPVQGRRDPDGCARVGTRFCLWWHQCTRSRYQRRLFRAARRARALIAANVVLTAAHCVCAIVTDVYEGSSVYTPTYMHKPVSRAGLAGQMRTCNAPRSPAADIGIVRIADQFKHTNSVTLASVSTINNIPVVRAVGFGETETGQDGQMKYVDIPIASPDCNHLTKITSGKVVRDQDFHGCSAGFELVAGQSHLNHDTCHGDSGGPIFGYVAKGGGALDEYLIGITSSGINSAEHTADCGLVSRFESSPYSG